MLRTHLEAKYNIEVCFQRFPWMKNVNIDEFIDEYDRIMVLGRKDILSMIVSQMIGEETGLWTHTFKDVNANLFHAKLMPNELLEFDPFSISIDRVDKKTHCFHGFLKWIMTIEKDVEFYWYEDLVSNDVCIHTMYMKNNYDGHTGIINYDQIKEQFETEHAKVTQELVDGVTQFCKDSKNIQFNNFSLL